MKVLYQDDSIAVALKPSGVLSQGDSRERENMIDLFKKEGIEPLYPVHRLDRETAGVMVFAKTEKAAAALSRAIAEKQFHKTYFAVTSSALPEDEGVMEDLLFHDVRKNKVFPVKRPRGGVRKALLSYKALFKGDLSLYEVRPETGRTHQIRVQFASRRCPLLGDRKYGGKPYSLFDPAEEEGLALFAAALSFPHPETGKLVSFSLPLPDSFPWRFFQ